MTAPATAPDAPASTGSGSLTKLQKLAVLLMILGPDSAAQVLRQFDENELEAVSAEMARLGMVGQDVQAEVLREFSDVAVQAGTGLTGGTEFVRDTLEKAVGQPRAVGIVNRIASEQTATNPLGPIRSADPQQLFNTIRREQPQTIALVASHLPPERASRLLSLCAPELRHQVVERLASLSPTPMPVMERIVAVIADKLESRSMHPYCRSGGAKSAAAVLNHLDRESSRSLLSAIEERSPDLGAAIRHQMFTFEDLERLEPRAIQLLLREVDMRDLALALKKASPALQTVLLSGISKRAAETVREEMSFLGSVKLRDVEAAKSRMIEVVRRLESEGEIELGGPESDAVDEIPA